MPSTDGASLVTRRQLVGRGVVTSVAVGGLPALVAACGGDDDDAGRRGSQSARRESAGDGEAIVGDVLDFALTSDDWEGAFGFVSMRLHEGVVDGDPVWFVRTDASDESFASAEKLVFAPKLKPLTGRDLSGELMLVDDGPAVLSSHPGKDDYTPAWRVRRARWRGTRRELSSLGDVRAAERAGDLRVEDAGVVLNAAIVKWPGAQLGVDRKLRKYLEGGQLIEPPDTRGGEVKFKLHECFPNARYIVTDHSIAPAAEMTKTALAPRLHGRPRDEGATGRTNVFMDGVDGSGPMEAQPSVFDSDPGDPEWSPYWDHFTYRWTPSARARVLRTERQVHAARDRGEIREFPGTPDTDGEVFTVNCPVPVTAPATFRA